MKSNPVDDLNPFLRASSDSVEDLDYDHDRYLVLVLARDWWDFMRRRRGPFPSEITEDMNHLIDGRVIHQTAVQRHLDYLVEAENVEIVQHGKRKTYAPTANGRRAAILYLRRRAEYLRWLKES